ncbi:40S ribosomal protein S4 [Mortierella claussenii]|nr:40S ribosomal protein S4 [Mortierella claussenii]
MSLGNFESPTLNDNSLPAEGAVSSHFRKNSVESSAARSRREAIALDGQMFESFETGSPQDDAQLEGFSEKSEPGNITARAQMHSEAQTSAGQHTTEPDSPPYSDKRGAFLEIATSNIDKTANMTDPETKDSPQKTSPLSSSSSTSSSSSSSSASTSPGTPPESPAGDLPAHLSVQDFSAPSSALPGALSPPSLARSVSFSKRQSMFLPDHISISEGGPSIESSSFQSTGSNDDREDMKEVQIETTDPSHLFWVPFHLHPEIAPNEYNKWLTKHGVESEGTGEIISSRKASIARRKSVLSAQYNPEDDQEEQPSKPTKIAEKQESDSHDFLSGVFSMPLEQMGDPPLKTKTSLRRSVSLSVSSPTREHFPTNAVEEDLMAVKRPGGLERGGLSLLRRSARTKIRRNSTASNDTRTDVSRLRQTINANGEYAPVSLVDPGPLPLPSVGPSSIASSEPSGKTQREGETQPLKRFISTLRDSSKPTITTYVEPHLLEQQRRENEEVNGGDEAALSFRVSAPGQLENSVAVRLLAETTENHRKEKPENNFTISYPIPPPVKLSQNLLQQASTSQSPSSKVSPASQTPSKQKPSGQSGPLTHGKKPSTWSWLWGKEKGSEKVVDSSGHGSSVSPPLSAKTNNVTSSSVSSTELNTQTSSFNEVTLKKPSTLSMLFSRNGKSASSKTQATTVETSSSATVHGLLGQPASERPKYSNYNRLPIHIERAIYRLSHVKLANPRRPLHEQVLISNMMFWYLGVIQQQQLLQQQAEQQQQQQAQHQKERSNESELSEDSKDTKSKSKPRKRKSQKKKNQQRGSSKSAERPIKSPEYERQQQQQQQQQYHVTGPRQKGASLAAGNNSGLRNDQGNDSQTEGAGQKYSDSFEELGGDAHSAQTFHRQQVGSQSDALSTLSIKTAPQSTHEDEEDDDVPLAHYQNMPRQTVSARGPKKHLKRLNAPKHWMLDKLTGTYAPRPTAGPHKLRECLPLVILMRNRLKYALNGKEVQSILMQRLVKVDGKVRTDSTFPAGFMDAITIEKTGENFRLVYDTKGRFTVHRITAEEAKYKLCKVKKVQLGAKGIPFVVTHDGRTLRYPDPLIKVNDTVKLDLETGKFNEFIKFEVGNVAMVTGGRNTGRVGVITHRERHVGGFDIVHIKDVLDRQFATRLSNVFVIGEGNKPWVSLPKNKGVKLTIAEERDRRRAAAN